MKYSQMPHRRCALRRAARGIQLLVCIWILFSLAACGQKVSSGEMPRSPDPSTEMARTTPSSIATSAPTEAPSETPPPASQIDLQPQELHGVIIHFWHPWSGAAGETMRSLVEEFNLQNEWKITAVAVSYVGLDRLEGAVNQALRDGEPPDLVAGYMQQALVWDAQRTLLDLQDYIEDGEWGIPADQRQDFYSVFWEQDIVQGRRLGVPVQRSAQVLFYNRSWAQELGYPISPITPQQFEDQACAAARANQRDESPDNDGSGGWIASNNYAAALGWIYAFGGEILQPTTSQADESVYRFNNPEVSDAFTFLRELYNAGCVWAPEIPYPETEFARRLGLFSSGSVMDIPYLEQTMQRFGGDQWTVLAYPSPASEPALTSYGPSLAIFTSSPQRQLAAWLLLRWLIEPRHHARLVEATSSFPIRKAELAYLGEYQKRHPQWAAALELIPYARSEPTTQSWSKVRWALGDAFTQLFRSYFSTEQLPAMLNYLDLTASELHLGAEKSGVFATPTITEGATPPVTEPVAPSPPASPSAATP